MPKTTEVAKKIVFRKSYDNILITMKTINKMMFLLSLLSLHPCNVVCSEGSAAVSGTKQFIYNVYEYNHRVSVTVNNETEHILDFVEANSDSSVYPTRVFVSSNDSVTPEFPVFITAIQQKGVSSWELPPRPAPPGMARTLCPRASPAAPGSRPRPTIHVATESAHNTTVDIMLTRVDDFYVEVNKTLTVEVSPTTPKYYYFSFDDNPSNVSDHSEARLKGIHMFNYSVPRSVLLEAESGDALCAVVSVQGVACPVFDTDAAQYRGYHLTMTTRGGITVTQSMFPNGFYVVFMVKETDDECTGESGTGSSYTGAKRVKQFRLTAHAHASWREYLVSVALLGAVMLLVAAFVLTVAAARPAVVVVEEAPPEPVPSTSRSEEAPILSEPSEHEHEHEHEREHECDMHAHLTALTVGRLSQASEDTMARRSERYFWGALTMAVVYALPVTQLLYAYQRMVYQTGNQDLCYYNFLCAAPLWGLNDFNHVASNLGYIILGAVFIGQVWRRQRRARAGAKGGGGGGGGGGARGVPQHYGLLYSMGLALAMEGFLSACYHLCPNKMNFQFDSSFMYVIAVLVMLKLYQSRHSDLVPSAHATFMLLALVMSIGVVGILFPSRAFSVLFCVLHLATCLVLTLKIYYAGRFKMERSVVTGAWFALRSRPLDSLKPTHTARAVLLALANIANWTFAIYCVHAGSRDLARQLLAVLLGNALLYTVFYLAMKRLHREALLLHTWVYVALSALAWAVALYFFVNGNTRWSETPAQSRARNARCASLGALDAHDAWHAASAAALFASFNMLLTVDDALAATPRHLIHTF